MQISYCSIAGYSGLFGIPKRYSNQVERHLAIVLKRDGCGCVFDCQKTPILFSTETNNVQQILWKKIESEFLQRNFSTAQEWCRFGQHVIFQQAKLANRSKILRSAHSPQAQS